MEFRRQEGSHSPPPFREPAFTKPLPSFASSSGRGGGGSTEPTSHAHPAYPDGSSIPQASSAGAVGVGGEGVVGGGASGSSSRPVPIPATITTSITTNAAVEAARYKECLRNHAASLGGHVVDGCGEFMPCGSAEPLKCAACGCHRSFHRKELEGSSGNNGNLYYRHHNERVPLLLPPPVPPSHPYGTPTPSHRHHHKVFSPGFPPSPSAAVAFTSGSGGTTTESSSEERNAGNPMGATPPSVVSKKRFRTKFTAEQKEKMLGFAERVGWRVQRQDDAATERFCTEIGVSRQVLKVWMHNNKQSIKRQQQQQEAQQQHQQQQLQEQQSQHSQHSQNEEQRPYMRE